jgi:hypothetical protein
VPISPDSKPNEFGNMTLKFEVEIVKIEEGLYYCSDGSRVTKEMLKFIQ